jgi:hypothetical protein
LVLAAIDRVTTSHMVVVRGADLREVGEGLFKARRFEIVRATPMGTSWVPGHGDDIVITRHALLTGKQVD